MVATRKHSKPYPEPETPSGREKTRKQTRGSGPTPARTPASSRTRALSRSRSRARAGSGSGSGSGVSPTKPPPAKPASRAAGVSSTPGSWTHRPSPLVTLWLFAATHLVLWDAGYVLLRPHSMPGGCLAWMWKPYDLYGRVDHMYGWPEYRAGNGLTMAQSILSLAEVAGYLYYLTTIWRHSAATRQTRSLRAADAQRRSLFERAGSCASRWLLASQNSLGGRPGVVALLVVFAASIMALNRAVLYLLLQPCSRYRDIGHNEPAIAFFLWLVPNTLRVLLPAYAAYYFASEILNALETVTGVPARERAGRIKTL